MSEKIFLRNVELAPKDVRITVDANLLQYLHKELLARTEPLKTQGLITTHFGHTPISFIVTKCYPDEGWVSDSTLLSFTAIPLNGIRSRSYRLEINEYKSGDAITISEDDMVRTEVVWDKENPRSSKLIAWVWKQYDPTRELS